MSSLGVMGGGHSPHAIFQQNLFNQIDSSANGSITKSELEQAVTSAGGSTQGADALFALLDPTNTGSVNEPQFSQNLPAPHFGHRMGAQMIGFQTSGWPGSSGTGGHLAQSLFSQINTNGDGSISKSEFEGAVNSDPISGDTAQDALSALIQKFSSDRNGSITGNSLTSAQNALLSLLSGDPNGGSSLGPLMSLLNHGTNGGSGFDPLLSLLSGGTNGSSGSDPLTSLLNGGAGGGSGFNPLLSLLGGGTGASGLSMSGNTAQNALFALMQGSSTNLSTRNSDPSTAGTANSTNLAFAISVYQNQMTNQMFASMLGGASAGF
jgi:Ca2+-binding EF-hand superfamily protein